MNQTLQIEMQDPPKQDSENFNKHLEALSTPEEKLKACIDFMRECLSQESSPDFKGFWEARKACLPLFKEDLAPAIRLQLWSDYTELTKEGRRLKSLLDEETAFAVEQIDLAINALEEEVKGYHTHINEILEKTPDIDIADLPKSLEKRISFYQNRQKQLNLLNLYASRINALRKELIRTEMRIRQKNKFFQKLSQLGDQIFPNRKDLIQQISEAFIEDVTDFAERNFSEANFNEERIRRSVFFYRGEIKSLQSIAKLLTLNTHAFSSTRQILSQCWDMLKGMEKELKKEHAEYKQKTTENANSVREKIEAFNQAYQANSFSNEEALRELDRISYYMREISLSRGDVTSLKEELRKARAPLEEKQEVEAQAKKQKEVAFEKARQEKVETLKSQIETLQNKIETADVAILNQELEEARKTLQQLSITKAEKQHMERTLKNIRDQISGKQSQALLSLSDADRAALGDLERLASELAERRKEIKGQIEEYRKIIGGSGLDFEKAMRYNEMMENEKESLAKIDENITEIKKKMRELRKG
jgi:DNA repair exonuclease SbcCD ATPase subunit